MPVITNKMDPQGIGSALTYYRRYSLSAIVGISADEDDDAEKAMGRNESKKSEKPKTIDKPQWTELNQLIEQCDPEHQKNIWDYLTSQGIHSFAEMPENMFNKLKKSCIGNIQSKEKVHAIGQN